MYPKCMHSGQICAGVVPGRRDERYQFTDAGATNRNSKSGTPFESKRSPVSDDGGFEFFHVCRLSHCAFVGVRDSANFLKGAPVIHLAKISYSCSHDEPSFSTGGVGFDGDLAVTTACWFGKRTMGFSYFF